MIKEICPYCKKEMTERSALPPMRPRWQRIYSALLEAGPEGIPTEDLLVRMYSDEELPTAGGFVVLRVSIHEMNKRLKEYGQNIINWYRGRYRLIAMEKEHEAKEIQPQSDH